jgi:thioredoxin 1
MNGKPQYPTTATQRVFLVSVVLVSLLLTASPCHAWRSTLRHNQYYEHMLLRIVDRERVLSSDSTTTYLHASMKFKTFEEMLTQFTDTPVVVSFHNSLCGPCRLMKKELTEVSDILKEDVKMFAVDTEVYPKLGQRYEVSGLPTVMIFHQGAIRGRFEGFRSSEEIIKSIQEVEPP